MPATLIAHDHQFIGFVPHSHQLICFRGARPVLKARLPPPPGGTPRAGMPAGLHIPWDRPWISTGGSRTHSLPSKKTLNLLLDFDSILTPKMLPKAFKNRSKIDQKDLWFFDGFFKPFWLHFGSLFSSLLLPKICQNRKRRFYEN